MKNNEDSFNKGLKMMVVSTFSFSLMNIFVKELSHLPAMEIVFFRCLFSLTACLVLLRGSKENILGNNFGLLFLRGASGTFALYCFFLTVQSIPLGSAVTISYLSPIFTTVIAIFFLNEKVGKIQWLFYAVSFSGVFLIKGFESNFETIYLITGLCAAFFSGIAYNLVRSLKERENPLVIVLHFQIVGVAVGFLFTLFEWKMPSGSDWIYLLLIGILTQIGQIYLTKALQAEKIAKVSIIGYTGIIYALIVGWLLYGETYNLQTLGGMLLVIGGVVLSVIFGKPKSNETASQS